MSKSSRMLTRMWTTLGLTLVVGGALFEAAGLLVLAYGLCETRRAFDPSRNCIIDRIAGWFRRRWPFGHRDATVELEGVAAGASFSAASTDVQGRGLPGPEGRTIEQQVADLRKWTTESVEELHLQDSRTRAAVDEEARRREAADAAEREGRRTAVNGLRADLGNLATGGLRLEALGTLLLILGVVASGIGAAVLAIAGT